MFPAVALNVAAEVSVMAMANTAAGTYTLYMVAFISEPVATIVRVPAVWALRKTKLLPALVSVIPVCMSRLIVPTVNA